MGKPRDKKGKSKGGGGLLAMRSGMRRVVGAEKGPKKKVSPFWNVVSWVVVAALIAATAFVLYRRFGGA
jgi:hypothetical protein